MQQTGTKLHTALIRAAADLIDAQRHLIPRLARAISVSEPSLLKMGQHAHPGIEQAGVLPDRDWYYFFHGLEVNLWRANDGYFVRIDFAPHASLDDFGEIALLVFAVSPKGPDRHLSALKEHLVEDGATRSDDRAFADDINNKLVVIDSQWNIVEEKEWPYQPPPLFRWGNPKTLNAMLRELELAGAVEAVTSNGLSRGTYWRWRLTDDGRRRAIEYAG